MNTYAGFGLDWAHGRLKWANDALDHIDQYGFVPGDSRPYTLATDLPIICDVLGNLADGHPTVSRIKSALVLWRIEPIRL
jgi:hypothetical protein